MANSAHVNKYAKGLFDISIKNNSSVDVRDGLNSIIEISKSIPEFNHLLFTKNTSRTDKKTILSNAFFQWYSFNILKSVRAISIAEIAIDLYF